MIVKFCFIQGYGALDDGQDKVSAWEWIVHFDSGDNAFLIILDKNRRGFLSYFLYPDIQRRPRFRKN